MIKKRGYVATALLVLAIVGGYVVLLPMLASLSPDPTLPKGPGAVASANRTVRVSNAAQDAAQTTIPPKPKPKPRKVKPPAATTGSASSAPSTGVNDGGSAGGNGTTQPSQPSGPDLGGVSGGLSGGTSTGSGHGGAVCVGSSSADC